ncbi:MAG: 50S ribosomal protein L21 [Rickettsiaceae bacterium]
MFAVIKTGGRQYQVSAGNRIDINKIDGEPGSMVNFEVLMFCNQSLKPVLIGTPVVHDAYVKAKITKHFKGKKILVFKKKRRQDYRRKNGHRQDLTQLEILEVSKAS